MTIGLAELHQINRWFQAAKDAAKGRDADMAWTWANQGQHYVNQLIAKLEAPPKRSNG